MTSTVLQESLILHCKVTIKSLHQLLTTLQSTDGIQELRRDEETMTALSEIASLTLSNGGIPAQSLDDGADPVEDGIDSEGLTRDRPPVAMPLVEGPPLPGTFVSQPPGPSMGFSSEGKALHSILLYYPLMSMIGLPLLIAERDRIQEEIESVTSTQLFHKSYPRIRLLDKQVVLIIHDDAEELERLRARFLLAQQSRWEQSYQIGLDFRLVRVWGKPLILLIFQHDYDSKLPTSAKRVVQDIVDGRKDVVTAVNVRFPILRKHQQLGGMRHLFGGRIHKGARISHTFDYGLSRSFQSPHLAAVFPITSGDFDFAQDFATFHTTFTYEGVDFTIKVERLQNPTDWLAENGVAWGRVSSETVTSYKY